MRFLRRGCDRHRPALLESLMGLGDPPGLPAALEHLDRCDRCRAEVETASLVVIALHRLGDEAARVEVPAMAWPRLLGRLAHWRLPRPAFMSPLAGTAMSLAILVAVSVGGTVGPATDGASSAGIEPGGHPLDPAEVTWLRAHMQPTNGGSRADDDLVPPTSAWPGPDGRSILLDIPDQASRPASAATPPGPGIDRRS